MIALQERTIHAGIAHHAAIFPRIYEADVIHLPRIERARKMVKACLPVERIVELGSGTCDISGPFSTQSEVRAYDCNRGALAVAVERYPSLQRTGNIPNEPEACDLLVLCEVLEHLPYPADLVKAWLPLAANVIISHPLNGDRDSDHSAGEHQWSFDHADFESWFELGGHELIERDCIRIGGCYDIVFGRGKRK